MDDAPGVVGPPCKDTIPDPEAVDDVPGSVVFSCQRNNNLTINLNSNLADGK